jgi:hypothetical protein
MIVISMIQRLSHSLYPFPPGFDPGDRGALAARMRSAPSGALIMVLMSYIAGSFAGGLITALIAGTDKVKMAMITGLFFLVAGIANLVLMPGHPVWFMILTVLIYLPMAWIGGKAGQRFSGSGKMPDR